MTPNKIECRCRANGRSYELGAQDLPAQPGRLSARRVPHAAERDLWRIGAGRLLADGRPASPGLNALTAAFTLTRS